MHRVTNVQGFTSLSPHDHKVVSNEYDSHYPPSNRRYGLRGGLGFVLPGVSGAKLLHGHFLLSNILTSSAPGYFLLLKKHVSGRPTQRVLSGHMSDCRVEPTPRNPHANINKEMRMRLRIIRK